MQSYLFFISKKPGFKIEENGDLFGEDIEKVEKQNEIKEVNENEEDDDENNPKEETNMKENECFHIKNAFFCIYNEFLNSGK